VETENTDKEVIRSSSGQFVKGVSGNPKGRPKGAKNRITELKEAAELALREAVDPETIKRIFQSMAAEALDGVTNAKVEQERGEENPEIVIKIKNLSNAPVEIEEAEIIEHEDPTSG
jgi:hypothetical protein